MTTAPHYIVKTTDADKPFYLIQTFAVDGSPLFQEQAPLSYEGAAKEIAGMDNLKGARVFQLVDVTEEIAKTIADKSFHEWERPHYTVCEWLTALGIEYCEAPPQPSYVDLMFRQHSTLNKQQQGVGR